MPVPRLDEQERKQWGLDGTHDEKPQEGHQGSKPNPLVRRVSTPVWAIALAGLLFVGALGDGGGQQLDTLTQRATTAEQRLEQTEQGTSRLESEYAQRKADLDARAAQLDAREQELNRRLTAQSAPPAAAQSAPRAPAAQPPAPKPPAVQPAPKAQPRTVSYANCSEAKAAGAAPLRQGDPGYAPRLDRDSDGVACE